MAVYLSGVAFLLYILLNAPFCLFWRLEWGEERGLYLAVRFSIADFPRTAERVAFSSERPKPKPKKKKSGHGSKAENLVEAILYVFKRKSTRVRVSARVQTGDAYATALLCGFLHAAGGALRIPLRAEAGFSSDRAHIALRGMIRVKIGNIVMAALLHFARTKRRRLAQWKESPLKAS